MFPSADTMRFCHQLDYATSGVLVITNPSPDSPSLPLPDPIFYSCLPFWGALILALRSLRCGLMIGRLQTLSQSNSVKGLYHTTTTEHIPSTLLFPTQFIPCPTMVALSTFVAPEHCTTPILSRSTD